MEITTSTNFSDTGHFCFHFLSFCYWTLGGKLKYKIWLFSLSWINSLAKNRFNKIKNYQKKLYGPANNTHYYSNWSIGYYLTKNWIVLMYKKNRSNWPFSHTKNIVLIDWLNFVSNSHSHASNIYFVMVDDWVLQQLNFIYFRDIFVLPIPNSITRKETL